MQLVKEAQYLAQSIQITKSVPSAVSNRNCTAAFRHKYSNTCVMKNLENTNCLFYNPTHALVTL
jgi:hypothetical protein